MASFPGPLRREPWQHNPDLCQLSVPSRGMSPPNGGTFGGRFPVDAFRPRSYTGSAPGPNPSPGLSLETVSIPHRSSLCLRAAGRSRARPRQRADVHGRCGGRGPKCRPGCRDGQDGAGQAAGFDTIRVTAVWSPGQTAVPADQLQALQSIAAAGDFLGIRIVATVMNFGSKTTPLTLTARVQFARFAADLVRRVPSIREYIVGNEPNLNRYWLPQFTSNDSDAAATAYTQLLARTYDTMKAADRGVFIIGGSLAPRGIDRPGTGRDTHSPTAFIRDMGTAYRALKRPRPICTASLSQPDPTAKARAHPPRSCTLRDVEIYDKLAPTARPGVRRHEATGYDTADRLRRVRRVDSQTPATSPKRSFYGGREPATTKPVSEGVQAAHCPPALGARRLPADRARLPDLPCHRRDRLQPLAVRRRLRADGTPKSTRSFVKQEMNSILVRRDRARDAASERHRDTGGWSLGRAKPTYSCCGQGTAAVGKWVLADASTG